MPYFLPVVLLLLLVGWAVCETLTFREPKRNVIGRLLLVLVAAAYIVLLSIV